MWGSLGIMDNSGKEHGNCYLGCKGFVVCKVRLEILRFLKASSGEGHTLPFGVDTMGISQNKEYQFGSPHNEDFAILGPMLGPLFW